MHAQRKAMNGVQHNGRVAAFDSGDPGSNQARTNILSNLN